MRWEVIVSPCLQRGDTVRLIQAVPNYEAGTVAKVYRVLESPGDNPLPHITYAPDGRLYYLLGCKEPGPAGIPTIWMFAVPADAIEKVEVA